MLNPPDYNEAVGAITIESRIARLEADVRELRALVEQLGTDLRINRARIDEYEDRAKRIGLVKDHEQKMATVVPRITTLPTTMEIATMKKVTNAMLYLKFALASDLGDMRKIFIHPGSLDAMRKINNRAVDGFMTARRMTLDQEYERHYNIGATLWESLPEEDKTFVRESYSNWKVQMKELAGIDFTRK